MPTLEQVCKRLFSNQSSLLKCLIGGLFMVVPVAHLLAFGFLYSLIDQARRGEAIELPAWRGWWQLFTDGVVAFFIFCLLGLVPIGVGWMLSWPARSLAIGYLAYIPMIPGLVLAAPFTAAGIYQYQKTGEMSGIFRFDILVAMLQSARQGFYVPSLSLLGFLIVGYPLMPITLFIGLAAAFAFYSSYFRALEESRKAGSGTT